jgi:hypothetical protein
MRPGINCPNNYKVATITEEDGRRLLSGGRVNSSLNQSLNFRIENYKTYTIGKLKQ